MRGRAVGSRRYPYASGLRAGLPAGLLARGPAAQLLLLSSQERKSPSSVLTVAGCSLWPSTTRLSRRIIPPRPRSVVLHRCAGRCTSRLGLSGQALSRRRRPLARGCPPSQTPFLDCWQPVQTQRPPQWKPTPTPASSAMTPSPTCMMTAASPPEAALHNLACPF